MGCMISTKFAMVVSARHCSVYERPPSATRIALDIAIYSSSRPRSLRVGFGRKDAFTCCRAPAVDSGNCPTTRINYLGTTVRPGASGPVPGGPEARARGPWPAPQGSVSSLVVLNLVRRVRTSSPTGGEYTTQRASSRAHYHCKSSHGAKMSAGLGVQAIKPRFLYRTRVG